MAGMKHMRRSPLWLALLLWAGACNEDPPYIAPTPPPIDAGCVQGDLVRRYEVYFVLDVSGSMEVFLDDLAAELGSLALGFPERDRNDDRVIVNYYVVGFVNDVKLFPAGAERMTSHIAVGYAIREAIAAAEGNINLNNATPNADADENLMDALGAVIDNAPSADATLVLIATDQGFREAGQVLSGGVQVQRSYDEVFAGLKDLGVRVHAFVPGPLDGLTRPYREQPALTTIGDGEIFLLEDLTAARESIQHTLLDIAQGASCNPTGSLESTDASP